MRVLYYHQHFCTPEGSTGTRSYELSRRLVQQGHAVTMVCGSGVLAQTGLSGEYRGGRREGLVDGIRVIEWELPYSNYDSFLRRALTFLRFAWRSVVLALREDYDLVFATSTPLTAGIPGIAARWLRRKPFVFEVRDLWPELPKAMGVIKNPLVLLGMDWLEFASYRSANHCVALSPGIAQGIARRGVPPGRITTIPNACDLDVFRADPQAPLPALPGIGEADFVAAFTGAHGTANGLGAVLDAAAELKRRGRNDIKFLFVGDGREKPALQERARREGLDSCVFLAPVTKRELAQLLCRRINVGLMILANVPAFYYGTSPNKFFDYLASSLPVLVNYPGWIAEMVGGRSLGRAVPPGDAKAFADALCEMAADRTALGEAGRRGRRLAEGEFARDHLVNEHVALLARIADGAHAAAPLGRAPR